MVEKERVNGKDTGKLVSIDDSDLNSKAKAKSSTNPENNFKNADVDNYLAKKERVMPKPAEDPAFNKRHP